jgi:hypothetical protein
MMDHTLTFILLPFAFTLACAVCVFAAQDRRRRQARDTLGGYVEKEEQPTRTPTERAVLGSLRHVLLLSALINTISFATPPSHAAPASSTALADWLHTDATAIVNCLHGCFLLGGYVNYTKTGVCVCVCVCVCECVLILNLDHIHTHLYTHTQEIYATHDYVCGVW